MDNHSAIARNEIFGPVLSVITANEDDPVAIANDSSYGLNSGVSPTPGTAPRTSRGGSGRHGRAQRAPRLARVAFGGFKQSGLGRESGLEGIGAYVELQCIPYVP